MLWAEVSICAFIAWQGWLVHKAQPLLLREAEKVRVALEEGMTLREVRRANIDADLAWQRTEERRVYKTDDWW